MKQSDAQKLCNARLEAMEKSEQMAVKAIDALVLMEDKCKTFSEKYWEAEAKRAALYETLKSFLEMVNECADFRNGNAAQGFDEGYMMANNWIKKNVLPVLQNNKGDSPQ